MADKSQPYEGTQLYRAAQAIHERLADSTVELRFGRDALSNNDGRRRIVWVRPGGTTDPPSRAGGMYRSPQEAAEEVLPTTGAPAETPNGNRTQFCFEPVDAAVAHIYAESDALVEQLFYNLLAAIKLACGHLAQPGIYTFPNEVEGGALGKRQPKIALSVNFRFAAPDEVTGLFVVLREEHSHVWKKDPADEDDDESSDVHT